MRLTSITVRNYRIHRDLSTTLDPAITLIGGPNESGKSTLIEAAHRALFLKATCGGEAQKSMVPKHGGCPEVEVEFETGGKSYRVTKRFSGANGQASLIEIGGATLPGDLAESKLAQLFGVEPPGGGKNVLERVKEQWAHIWAWQGEAGEDPTGPTGHANSQSAGLIRQLQAQGGAVVLQSALDGWASDRFADFVRDTFTNKGKPKTESELGKAEAALEDARAKEQEAQNTFDALEQAMLDCDDAEREIVTIKRLLPGLVEDLADVDGKLRFAERLRNKVRLRKGKLEPREREHKRVADADKSISKLRGRIADVEEAMKPRATKTEELKGILDACRKAVERTQRDSRKASQDAPLKRAARDLAQAFANVFEKQAAHDSIEKRHSKAGTERGKLVALKAEVAALPRVTDKALKDLKDLDLQFLRKEAALNAMATGIDVLASDLALQMGDETLAGGDSRILNETTEITIGTGVRLRIRPGGGNSLAEARGEKDETERERTALLEQFGVESVAKAEEAVSERKKITADIKGVEKVLEGLGADSIDEDLDTALRELTASEAEVERRRSRVPDFVPPDTLEGARVLHTAKCAEADDAEQIETNAQEAMELANENRENADNDLQNHLIEFAQEQKNLLSLCSELDALLRTHGDDQARQAELSRLFRRKQRAEKLVALTERKLDELQPKLLASDRERLDAAANGHRQNLRTAEDKLLRATNSLQNHGTANPAADLANVQLSTERIRERHALEERRAEANKRLHDLFTEEQSSLAERFTQPLAEKISSYIECLFGPEARINLESDGKAFQKMSVLRPVDGGGEMEFDLLSGGAREQVAAAVRLAVAEILAADYDGTLPVVFDDAFAYSDAERVKGVQRMLFQASRRGLQVIVLACNPSDYSGLGGTTRILPKPAVQKIVPSPAPRLEPTETLDTESDAADSGTSEKATKPLPKSSAKKVLSSPSHHPEPTETSDAEPDVIASRIEVPEAEMEDRRQRFLNALRAAFGGSAGNIKFREHLGWDLATYEAIREDLVSAGRLVKGQGQGGTVRTP